MTPSTAYDRVTDALGAAGSAVRTVGERQAQAQCPAHDDRAPSLSITNGEARVLLKCHAGCDIEAIVDAIGLTMADLFDEPRPGKARHEVARYTYTDAAGTVLFEKIRYEPKDFRVIPPGAVRKLDHKPLYRLPEVLAAAAAGSNVYVVEGEKDADALTALGHVATCNYDGAGKPWRPEYTQALKGAQVVIVADRDDKGYAHAKTVHEALERNEIPHTTVQAATGKDAFDHLAAGHTVDQLEPLTPEVPAGVDELFPVLDWHQLWAETPDDVEWVCEPLLEAGRSTAIYSPPKAGKSLLALEIAAALATGRPVLGNPPRLARVVLYVDLENTGADIKERLQALGYTPADLGNLRYLSFPSLAALDSPTGGRQIVALVDHHQAGVVILDTVSRVIAGEENDADTFAALYRHTFVPLKARGVTVARLDHSGKDADRGQRGSSAKSADVDHVWRLTSHDHGRITLKREATRTGHGADWLDLERRYEPLRHERPGIFALPARINDIVAELDGLAVPTAAGRDTARKALKEAGIRVSNDDLTEALRERKNLSRTGDAALPTVGQPTPVRDGSDSTPEPSTNTCPGQVPDRSGHHAPAPADDLSAVRPSLKDGQVSTPDQDTHNCTSCEAPLWAPQSIATGLCAKCAITSKEAS